MWIDALDPLRMDHNKASLPCLLYEPSGQHRLAAPGAARAPASNTPPTDSESARRIHRTRFGAWTSCNGLGFHMGRQVRYGTDSAYKVPRLVVSFHALRLAPPLPPWHDVVGNAKHLDRGIRRAFEQPATSACSETQRGSPIVLSRWQLDLTVLRLVGKRLSSSGSRFLSNSTPCGNKRSHEYRVKWFSKSRKAHLESGRVLEPGLQRLSKGVTTASFKL